MIDPQSIDLSALPYVALSDRYTLPPISGVYFAIDCQSTVQYIGLSKNIRLRWFNHHRYQDLQDMSDVKIAYLAIKDVTLLPEAERILIDWFNPCLNKMRGLINPGITAKKRANLSTVLRRSRPKAADNVYGETKKPRQFLLTKTASDKLSSLADKVDLSRSELLERYVRWLESHWNEQFQREIGEKKSE